MSDSSTLPKFESPSLESSSSQLRKWQLKLLSGALLLGLVISFLMLGLSFFSSETQYRSVLIIGSVILGFGSGILILLKNFSFWVRSIFFLVIFFFFTNSLFFFYGWGIPSLITLSGFIAISTTLLFRRSIRYGLITSFLTLVLWGALTISRSFGSQNSTITFSNIFNDGFIVCAIGFFIYFSLFQLKELYLSKIDENQEKVKEVLEVNNKYQKTLALVSYQEDQLRKLMELTRRLPLGLSQQDTIARFTDEFEKMFDLSTVAIYLLDSSREKIEIIYGTEISGKKLLANKHHYTTSGPSIISQAVRKNIVISEVLNKVYDLSILLVNEDDNQIVHAVPLTKNNRTIGALLILTEPTIDTDDTRLLIFSSAAQLLSMLIHNDQDSRSRDFSRSTLPDTHSLETLLRTEKTTQYSFPEGEALSISQDVPLNKISLSSPGQLNATLRIPERELSQSELEFIDDLASQTSRALKLAASMTSMQKAVLSEEKSKSIASKFSGKKKMEDVLKAAVIELGKLPDVLDAKITLISPDDIEVSPRLNGSKDDNAQ